MPQEEEGRFCHGVGGIGGEEKASFVIEDGFAKSRKIGADERQACGCGFQGGADSRINPIEESRAKQAQVEAGDRRSQGELRQICDEAIKTGKAYEVFARSCQQQGAALDALKNLEMAPLQAEILAEEDGVLQVLDAGGIGRAGLLLGMGRLTQEDKISHGNCFEILRRKGAAVKKGMPLLRIYAADHLQQIPAVVALIRKGILIDSGPAPDYAKDLVLDSIQ